MKKGNVLLKIVIVFIICLSIFSLEVQANDVNLEADDMVKTYGDENSLNSFHILFSPLLY